MWHRFFGPVLFYDLLGTARRGRHLLFRVLYAVVLCALLFLLYSEEVGKRGGVLWADWRVPQTQRQDVLRFNQSFFQRFTLVQFAVILLLTPGVTAGAIAEEKERRTLEFLLTTELRGHEIVLGKLLSRLAYMILLVLTGLPMLALLQLLGGVDPNLILAGFAASGLTLFSLACLSILNSVLAAKPRTAIFAAYIEIVLYLAGTLLFVEVSDPAGIPEPVQWLCAGNPYLAFTKLRESLKTTGTLANLQLIFTQYAFFHGLLALLCLIGALFGLRLWNRWQASQGSRRSFVVFLKPKRLPRVGRRPVLWKELHAEPFLRMKRGGMIVLTSLWFGCLLIGGLVLFAQLFIQLYVGSLPKDLAAVTQRLTTITACLAIVGAAIHTAGAFSGERDRQTLDSLLTTPLENRAIVWGKWWGGFLSVRKAWYCLAAIWVVGLITSTLRPFAVPLLVLACLVYTALAASVGLWFSLVCRTTLRAMFWTLIVLVMVGGGHRILMSFFWPLFSTTKEVSTFGSGKRVVYDKPKWVGHIEYFGGYGLTPPTILSWLASPDPDTIRKSSDGSWPSSTENSELPPGMPLTYCIVGLLIYVGMAEYFLSRVHRHFARATGRLPLRASKPRLNPLPSW
jgi:ABC-type transport system involved in multi-copper enzyme maturation permease subunit